MLYLRELSAGQHYIKLPAISTVQIQVWNLAKSRGFEQKTVSTVRTPHHWVTSFKAKGRLWKKKINPINNLQKGVLKI